MRQETKKGQFSLDETEFVKEHYQTMKTREIARKLNRKVHSVRDKVTKLGLNKTVTEKQRKLIIKLAKETTFPLKTISGKTGISKHRIRKVLKDAGIKRNFHHTSGWKKGKLLTGFVYNGKSNVLKHRHALLYAYAYTCWDCKKHFPAEQLVCHHDFTKLPVQVVVLCRKCHKKRHGLNG